jgi:hypothetical protein
MSSSRMRDDICVMQIFENSHCIAREFFLGHCEFLAIFFASTFV